MHDSVTYAVAEVASSGDFRVIGCISWSIAPPSQASFQSADPLS